MVGLQDEARSFPLRLQPEFHQAADGFRAGSALSACCDPSVDRVELEGCQRTPTWMPLPVGAGDRGSFLVPRLSFP